MIKKNLIGIVIVLVFFVGFYVAYTLGKNSSVQSEVQPRGNIQSSQPAARQEAETLSGQEKRPASQESVPATKSEENPAFAQSESPQPAANIKLVSAVQPAVVEEVAPANQPDSANEQTFYGTVVPFAEQPMCRVNRVGKLSCSKAKKENMSKKAP